MKPKHTHKQIPYQMDERGYYWVCPNCPNQLMGGELFHCEYHRFYLETNYPKMKYVGDTEFGVW